MKCLSIVLVCLVLTGCNSNQRASAGFVGVSEIISEYQVAVAKRYLECDREATTPAEEQDCYDQKEADADQIDEALRYLRAYGSGLIALDDQPVDGTALQQAQAVLRALLPALQGYMDPSYDQAVAWVEGE